MNLKVSLLYDNPPYYELVADGTRPPLQVVSCIKLLGLTIDSSLSFKAQVKSMYKKENVKVAALRRVRKTITPEVMVDICKAYILPHFGYCAPVLAGQKQLRHSPKKTCFVKHVRISQSPIFTFRPPLPFSML